MGIEIEYKFLVKPNLLPEGLVWTDLTQGWLSKDPLVRVRVSDNTAWLTVKGKGTVVRAEYEYEIPKKDGDEMLRMCRVGVLQKSRTEIRFGKHLWQVDSFRGGHAGLWLAEIELGCPGEPFETPPWVGRNVTEDVRYTNVALAENGIPPDYTP